MGPIVKLLPVLRFILRIRQTGISASFFKRTVGHRGESQLQLLGLIHTDEDNSL
jgi:hypothetical protein